MNDVDPLEPVSRNVPLQRAAGICFLLILTSGSVFHTVFSAYRECLTLILLLFFAALFLSNRDLITWWKTVLMGLLLGLAILTYYPLVFLPPFLLILSAGLAWVGVAIPVNSRLEAGKASVPSSR